MNHRDILEEIELVKNNFGTAVIIVKFRKGDEYHIETKRGEVINRPASMGGYDENEWSEYIKDMRINQRWGYVSLSIMNGEEIHSVQSVGRVTYS